VNRASEDSLATSDLRRQFLQGQPDAAAVAVFNVEYKKQE
jgi:hypothetical protein